MFCCRLNPRRHSEHLYSSMENASLKGKGSMLVTAASLHPQMVKDQNFANGSKWIAQNACDGGK